MPYRRAILLAAALFAAAALPPAAFAQIQLGRYESRPGGALLRCGGFAGTCAPHVLAGSLVIETTGPVPAGTNPTFVITASDLRLGHLAFRGDGAYPPPGALPLVGLEGEEVFDRIVFESPADASEVIELELFPAGESFVLRGSYLGLGDFVDEILAVTFDWTGEGPQPALRLDGGRFEVRVDWTGPQGGTGSGIPVKDDDLSGSFWFFQPDNPELQVKIVPACVPPFERVWFFASGLTDVGVTLHVRDLSSPDDPETFYFNPVGRNFPPIFDTVGFPCTVLP